MHIYEYLFTGIIIVAILLSSSIMITTLSEPTTEVSEKEQLKVAAEKLITQILLDPGHPLDWGSDTTVEPDSFGLAKHNETMREAYTLDPDKVLRLNLKENSSYYMPPSLVLELLNLGNDYGLAIEIYTPLDVSLYPVNVSRDIYEIGVFSEHMGLPVANAVINASLFFLTGGKNISSAKASARTGDEGKCLVDFSNYVPQATEILGRIIIVVVDYSSTVETLQKLLPYATTGIRVVKVFALESRVRQASILGNHVLFDEPINLDSEVHEIIVVKQNETSGYAIIDVRSELDRSTVEMPTFIHFEPFTVAALAVTEDGANLVLATRTMTLTYTSLPGVRVFPALAHSIERTVIIDGSTYTIRLTLWRMTW